MPIFRHCQVTRRRTWVRREAKFVRSKKAYLKGKIESSLERAKGYLRSELARRVQCRKMPELIFKYDEALEYGNHINSILNDLNIPTEEE